MHLSHYCWSHQLLHLRLIIKEFDALITSSDEDFVTTAPSQEKTILNQHNLLRCAVNGARLVEDRNDCSPQSTRFVDCLLDVSCVVEMNNNGKPKLLPGSHSQDSTLANVIIDFWIKILFKKCNHWWFLELS